MAKGKTNYPGGGVDTSDANAAASDIVASKTAYGAAGTKLTGTITEKVGSSTVITPGTTDKTIPEGRYGGDAGDGKVSGDADLVAGNIKSGVTIFGVTGNVDAAPTSMDAEANVLNSGSSINTRIYYRKFGKLYVFGTPQLDGATDWPDSRYISDSNTRARICTALGITQSSYYESRVTSFGDTSYNIYWNGSDWNVRRSEDKVLFAILAA